MIYIAAAMLGAVTGLGVGVIIYLTLGAIVWVTVYVFEGYPE